MNDDPERLDLSALDPERDPARWETLVQSTRFRVGSALRARQAPEDPMEILVQWARPVLAAAAALALVLGATQAVLGSGGGAPGEARRLARVTEHALLHGRVPTGAELRWALRQGAAR